MTEKNKKMTNQKIITRQKPVFTHIITEPRSTSLATKMAFIRKKNTNLLVAFVCGDVLAAIGLVVWLVRIK